MTRHDRTEQHDTEQAPQEYDGRAGAPRGGMSRRRLFAGAGAGVALGAVAGFAGGRAAAEPGDGSEAGSEVVDLSRSHSFYAAGATAHPAGIQTEPQRHCVYMTFDLTTTEVTDLQVLLARWSASISQLMAGRPLGAVEPARAGAVPQDTGEAYELGPSSLTVTVGLGPGVFDDRFGLAHKKPKLLAELPALPSDSLQKELTGGDLSIQACADDPQVAYHAVRDLARIGRGTVNTRWTVMGFGRASAGKGQLTPRNLMGFKDGTRNIKDSADFDKHVWVSDTDEPIWMQGGSYQVARKIRMDIEIWDADNVADQQRVFGRSKADGAPLSGHAEFDTPDFHKRAAGKPAIDPKSHIALAAHENNGGTKILRRSYNFTDGINGLGQLDAGLLFICYQNDPASFITLQRKLGGSDLLNEYISHIGSGIFAIPRAPKQGHYLAEELFARGLATLGQNHTEVGK